MPNAPQPVDSVILVTKKDKVEYTNNLVKPMLEELSTAYFAAQPPPEDIVAFLIDALAKSRGYTEPMKGKLDQSAQMEVMRIQHNIEALVAYRDNLQSTLDGIESSKMGKK
eukprot:gnl/TRDRNA2_/TRDRNA2_179806_c1_seq1.p1 gnl/TRDRNA2_/TRDRNA2_179806_c1~~gnl/TRDRNA2_/TRDRNA2_179806_c1_seq1.p1  ORF type:complete len:111 (-),score=36.08 gnl/TRDRNA2_/TRDRNA2_179806_c1_seq1:67-399(-)